MQKAWEEIIQKHDLKNAAKLQDMDIDRIFTFTDGSLAGGTLDLSSKCSSSRRLSRFSRPSNITS